MNILGYLQKLGRALMLPIATLPAAAILLRLGQPDVLEVFGLETVNNIGVIAAAGQAIFDNIALLFAVGVAIGLAKGSAAAAGLAAVVGYMLLKATFELITPDGFDLKVLGGILAGIVAAHTYNKFHTLKLPEFLSFFGGSRSVPIITAFFCLFLSVGLSIIWPPIQAGIAAAGDWMMTNGTTGSFVYGTLNRLLIPTGLHQVLNSMAWFVFGEYNGATGDIGRFFAGDPNSGMFMTGFFPIMMFGLPAACLAMYTTARKENRKKVVGILTGVGLTSFVTGVTEPVEFMFMFIAPFLYVIHAVLTGISLSICTALDIHLGFGFSAGLIDYALNFNMPAAKNAWMLIPIGLMFFAVYYVTFVVAIKTLNLATPGREAIDTEEAEVEITQDDDMGILAQKYTIALGGLKNLTSIEACITRLRLTLADSTAVDEKAMKALGAKGVIRLGSNNLQVIIGPRAELIANQMKQLPANFQELMAEIKETQPIPQVTAQPKPANATGDVASLELVAPVSGKVVPIESTPDAVFSEKIVGDGISIDPAGDTIVAPCKGTIGKIFETNHAFSMITEEDVELFVHFGIDTVELKGQGFTRIAEEGQEVQPGDPIIKFDLDYLKENAKSVITPVVISNIEEFAGLTTNIGANVTAGVDTVISIQLAEAPTLATESAEEA